MPINVLRKKIVLSSLCILIILVFSLFPKPEEKGFTIEGSLKGLSEGILILEKSAKYLGYTFTRVDSVEVKNGTFMFRGKVDNPEIYYIKKKGQRGRLEVFVENSRITVIGTSDRLKDAIVSGSTIHDKLIKFNRSLLPYETKVKTRKKQLKDFQLKNPGKHAAEREAEYDSALQERKEFIEEYIKDNSDSRIAPYLTLKYLSNEMDVDELSPLVSRFSPGITRSRYGKQLLERIRILSRVAVGKPAPDFAANTPGGERVTLSSLKGKFVLIDFWASWCGPCRKENPQMVEFYSNLKNKGFEIFGVGLEFSRDAWLKAIKEDKLPWINVSEIKGFDGIPSQYGIRSIPYTILLDKNGIIIDKNLRGEDLRNRILQLFKE